MSAQDKRLQEQTLKERLHRARETAELQDLQALARLKYRELQDQLVTCSLNDFPRLQGQAQAYRTILNDILRPAPTVNQTNHA